MGKTLMLSHVWNRGFDSVPLKAQFVVYDPTNYIEAVLQYEQIIRQYEFLIQQAKRVPVDLETRYHAVGAGAVHGLPACQHVFEAFVVGAAHFTGTHRADVQWFFKTRRLVDAGRLGSLSVADLNRFRDARATFGAPAIASLYARWLLHGDAVFAHTAAGSSPDAVHPGHLVIEQVPGQYAQFGTLAVVV